MFKWFKKNSNGQNGSGKAKPVHMSDIDGQPLTVGDKVNSLRYDLGICEIVEAEVGYDYVSEDTGERVNFSRMIDAATSFQKVRKL